ncbi:DUF202 domain-containing protein [Microbacterium esteraromaticum]|uniref:DUF202 domain-containing protein n=1 Tax=Microbacterium esteraromaticum TaxID=57043 RepID=UPI00195DFE7D|nr:DUF202 domain-containing protein [Microbacterium esteraromaticum]MBM7465599.1 putative membrane protein [Microbacterium esteraromaticum]
MSGSDRRTGPFDAGLQLERTSLSWRRTALSVAVGSLVSLRLLPEWLGGAEWVVPGMVGLLLACLLWIVSRRRHQSFMRQWSRGDDPRIGGALALMLIAAVVAAVGALGLIAVLLSGR